MSTTNAPQTTDQFFQRLRELGNGLPKRLRQCAEYIAANPDRIAVSTIAELSAGADVQPSAFMRFCQELGFSGFSQMQKLFRDDYPQKWSDYGTRLAKLREQHADNPAALLAEFVEAGRMSLENLMQTIKPEELEHAVKLLSNAKTIHIAGFRRAFPVASYLSYAFEKMNVPSILHSGIGNLSSEHMFAKGDALIAITFAPYSQETVDLAQKADEAGIDIVAMTDRMTSPLAEFHAKPLQVLEIDVGDFRTLSATTTLATTLAVAVGAQRKTT